MARRDPQPRRDAPELPARVRRLLVLARWALAWEAAAPAFLLALGVAAGVVAAAWLGVLQALPVWLHWGFLGAAGLAFLACLGRALARLRPGEAAAARRRLERANALAHRPLDVVLDQRASPADKLGAALWRQHRAQARAQLAALRPLVPRPNLAARDSWGLRQAGALVLVVAGAVAWGDWGGRLATGLNPAAGSAAGQPASVTAWLEPPAYTGQPPVYLTDREAGADSATPQVPAGSQLTVTVQGGGGRPELAVGGTTHRLAAKGEQSYRLQHKLARNGPLVLRQDGEVLRRWPLAVLADQVPTVELTKPPQGTAQGALKLGYRAVDDHGLAKLRAAIALAVEGPDAPGLSYPAPQLELPKPGAATNAATSTHQVAAHPWAGLPVTLTVTGTDGAGQTGRSKTVRITLPARSFDHPVAAEIVKLRRNLIQQPRSAGAIAGKLDALAARPGAFDGDRLVFMGLRSAAERLRLQQAPEAVRSVVDLLWAVATHLEDGGLARARAELRELERDLREALKQGAPGEKIDKLLKKFRQALGAYQRALAEKMAQQGSQQQPPRGDRQNRQVGKLLDQQLKTLQKRLETGNRQAAQQALERLSRTLDALQQAQPRRAQQNQARALSKALNELVTEQRKLMDETFQRRGARGEEQLDGQPLTPPGIVPPPPPLGGPKATPSEGKRGELAGLAQRQRQLRQKLKALNKALKELGGVPPGMTGAAKAMERARQALQQGRPGRAAQAQGEALAKLQQGGKQARQQLRRRAGQGPALLPGQRRGPLGRPLGPRGQAGQQGRTGGDVEVPGEGEQQRAREILEELRRKRDAAPPGSPLSDYLERLLKRF